MFRGQRGVWDEPDCLSVLSHPHRAPAAPRQGAVSPRQGAVRRAKAPFGVEDLAVEAVGVIRSEAVPLRPPTYEEGEVFAR